MASSEVEALLVKLRESRLATQERRTALDTLRETFETLDSDTLSHHIKKAIQNGPNDVRRIAFQVLAHRFGTSLFKDAKIKPLQDAVHDLIAITDSYLRTTLKLQSSRSVPASSRSTVDIASLPISTLRAIAAALKTLNILIQHAAEEAKTAALPAEGAGKHSSPNLVHLFDLLLPCLSVGLQGTRSAPATIPLSSSGLQVGAFSWSGQPRSSRSLAFQAERPNIGVSESTSTLDDRATLISEDLHGCSSAGETDRNSDQSESERSDFSTASAATTSSRSRKEDSQDSQQQASTTKLIRQNALHCFIELNRRESRALISRWNNLLPDQPAQARPSTAAVTQSSTIPRFSASAGSSASFSLCTIITQDPSTSVRLAAMSALGSILSFGTFQLSLAQERAQRALSFTSLSSQLATWIVNIRSFLAVALQRAANAPRASATSEGNAVSMGYPSSMTIALLQLTSNFVTSTAKARLVTSNESVLGPLVLPFVSHSDTQVQAAAKQVIVTLTPPARAFSGRTSTTNARTGRGSLPQLADGKSSIGPAGIARLQTQDQTNAPRIGILALLADDAEPTPELCERVLSDLEADSDLVGQLPAWAIFVRNLANAPTPLLDSAALTRLCKIWQRMTDQPKQSAETESAVLGTVADLCRALSKHTLVDGESSTSVLAYVKSRCFSPDESIRAAAVRVLGLLVLPSDIDRADKDHDHIATVLDDVLWGTTEGRDGALQDGSSLVRQRASWAFSNAMEARLRMTAPLDEKAWMQYARYCLDAIKDIEGVAVSAYRTSGSLLALLGNLGAIESCSWLGRSLLEQLYRVLSTTSKPPKSRWNAASALDRALGSDAVICYLLRPGSSAGDSLVDRIVDSLSSNLLAKVFKIRVSAATALLSLCVGADKSPSQRLAGDRLQMLGEQRAKRIRSVAVARLAELAEPAASKEAALYVDELRRLLERLVQSIPV